MGAIVTAKTSTRPVKSQFARSSFYGTLASGGFDRRSLHEAHLLISPIALLDCRVAAGLPGAATIGSRARDAV